MPKPTAFSRTLIRFREAKGFSVERLADASHTSTETIRKIEDGRSAPTLTTMTKLAKALGCSVAELVS